MDVQDGEIAGGLGLGGVVEVQHAERGPAVAGDDLPVVQVSVAPDQRVRCGPEQLRRHVLGRGTQRVALGGQFGDVLGVPQPPFHPAGDVGHFRLG